MTESREPITASVETDAAGRFRLELESAARYAIVVQAPGLAPEALIDVKPGRLVVALSKGDVLEGTVRDASTSAPLAGAEVRIVEAQGSTSARRSVTQGPVPLRRRRPR